jgi:predicted TIM-barrel fold metal-dependent hydrolase
VGTRALDFPVFDADNHFYETVDAFTRYLPPERQGLIQYVQVKGRTKIAVRGRISEFIPNPTFEVVAAPGAQVSYFKEGNPGGKTRREIMGQPIRSRPEFVEPEPRLAVMDELGLDRVLLWPTLASLLEERLRDDPPATHDMIHAYNRWLFDQWTFDYKSRIFPAPIITLPIVDRALEELDWVLERGARVILVRPAPVPGFLGTRSPAMPEFDPFWSRVADSGILVGMHASDSGYARYVNEWEGVREGELLPFADPNAFGVLMTSLHRAIFDTVCSLICHGLCSRFPSLRFAPIENGSSWVRPALDALAWNYSRHPHLFAEDPAEVFRRNIFVHPFHEEDARGLVDLLGPDRVVFGSDWPHPEGLADPLEFVDQLAGLPDEDVRKVMGGNVASVVGGH